MVKLKLHEPHIIVQGPKCEDVGWGYYQFPRVYTLPDGRVAAAVHVQDDVAEAYGKEKKWFVSDDEGKTWKETSPEIKALCGFETASGDRLWCVEQPTAVLGDDYVVPPFRLAAYSIPSDDPEYMKKAPDSKTFPEGIGKFTGAFGETYRTYLIDCLPDGLVEKKWKFLRYDHKTGSVAEEEAPLDWNYMATHTMQTDILQLMRPNLWGNIKIAPDGSLWAAHYDLYGANPENGGFYTYGTCYFLRSVDDGRSWKLMSYIDYKPDIKKDRLAYFRDGFDEPELEFMPDGSMIVLLRTAGVFHGAHEWGPSYISRSVDGGKTWAEPWVFDKCGVLPQLRKLKCGVTIAIYGRPGIYVRACSDPSGIEWDDPVEVMTDGDRSGLMNDPPARPDFHQWAGSCCNMYATVIGDNKIMISYSDFYLPDENGIKRKTCLSRVVEVV